MATTDLKLDEAGTLPRPGPIGRLVRLAYGILCLWFVYYLIQISPNLIAAGGQVRQGIWYGVFPGLFLISYVVNIGYSRAWKKWPAIVSAGVFLGIAAFGYLAEGAVETIALARAIWGWELYLFLHLGIAYVLAAISRTPGCEMRAFHDLYSRVTGIPTKEHYCPVGPLHPIDQWEAKRTPK
ncbi:MAG: hypothetical protein IIA09_19195 [Proteobacteria bacterium]|nr:hypothetical protein [Pseudomonadota bacterium]